MRKQNNPRRAAQARKHAAHNQKRKGVTYDAKKAQQRLAAITEKRSIAL
jgi:hypothetical protein